MFKSATHLLGAKEFRLVAGASVLGAALAIAFGLYSFAGGNNISIGPASAGPDTFYSAQTPFQLVDTQALEGCVDAFYGPQEAGNLILVSQNSSPPSPAALLSPAGTGAVTNVDQFNAPVRIVHDPYPVFAGLAVDSVNDRVVVADQNTYNLFVYDRSVKNDGMIQPLRKIGGKNTKIYFIAGVDVDPERREMYTVNNDIMDNMIVFSYDQSGDVKPARELSVSHGAWGVSVDGDHDEIAITTQHTNKISVYRQTAQGEEAPLRIIQGPATDLADPHGIFVDSANDEIVVSNHGSWHLVETEGRGRGIMQVLRTAEHPPLLPSTGQFQAPSLIVLPRTGEGNVRPLRVIQGPRTQLNLPLNVYVDDVHNEIMVANDGGNSILFFDRTAHGDVPPIRTIKGSSTGLRNPAGVYLDPKNDEIWVSNWGNRTITVYPRSAEGNVTPKRTFTVAPPNEPMAGFGNPGAVAYDPIRDELLVPN